MGQETVPKPLKFYDVEVSPHQLVCVSPDDFKSYGTSVKDFCRESDKEFCKAKAREGLCVRRRLFRAQSLEIAKTIPKVPQPKEDKKERITFVVPPSLGPETLNSETSKSTDVTLSDGQTVIEPTEVIPNFLNFLSKIGKVRLEPQGPVIRAKTANSIAQGWGREVWLGRHLLGRINYETEPPRISFNGFLPGLENQIELTYVWEHPLTKVPDRGDGWFIPFP